MANTYHNLTKYEVLFNFKQRSRLWSSTGTSNSRVCDTVNNLISRSCKRKIHTSFMSIIILIIDCVGFPPKRKASDSRILSNCFNNQCWLFQSLIKQLDMISYNKLSLAHTLWRNTKSLNPVGYYIINKLLNTHCPCLKINNSSRIILDCKISAIKLVELSVCKNGF